MNKTKEVILDKVHFFQNTRKTVFLVISELFFAKEERGFAGGNLGNSILKWKDSEKTNSAYS